MTDDRFEIIVLDRDNWQITDKETGEFANPVDGTTNVLKGLVSTMNMFYNEKEAYREKLIELGVSDVEYESKRYNTGLGDVLNE